MRGRHDFTAAAAADLREIGRYTKATWGASQARQYRCELELVLHKLGLNPGIGQERSDIAPRVRSFPVASHVAFYTPRRGGITILRLLHSSMDVGRAFERKGQSKKGRQQ